jgi:hypothetical protein
LESAEVRGTADVADIAQLAVTDAAVHAAETVHRRARFQHNQLARLRRRQFAVVGVPFAWTPQLDVEAVRNIAKRLERALG